MHNKKKVKLSDYSPKTQASLDKIIKEMCDENHSEDLEHDIIVLFEDIVRFFSGRSEDFIDFDSLTAEQRKELYIEIRAVIELLKKLKGGQDKEEAIKILSKGMISTFSKANRKHFVETLTSEDQKRLKETFARITIQQMHDKKIQEQKKVSDKDLLEKIKHSHAKFAEKIDKQNIERKSSSSHRGR